MSRFAWILLLIFGVTPAIASENFDLHVKIWNVSELDQVRLSLSYSLEQPGNDAMLTNGSVLKLGRDRDSNKQFNVEFPNIQFPEQVKRGFVHGELLDDKNNLVMQIPLTVFSAEDISSRGEIDINIQAREIGRDAFLNSYPPNTNNFVNEENVDFVLQSLKVLIDKNYVDRYEKGWERLYQFFHSNANYFKDGSRSRISRILSFLETVYDNQRSNPNVEKHFVKFYFNFLDALMKMDIGGRGLDTGSVNSVNLKDYVIARYNMMLLRDPINVLPEVVGASETLYSLLHTKSCVALTGAAIKSMSEQDTFISEIKFNDNNDVFLKKLMKLLVDCNQLDFEISDSSTGNISIKNNLKIGFENISENLSLMRDYMILFEKMEAHGLFRSKYRNSTFSSVYAYYEYMVQKYSG